MDLSVSIVSWNTRDLLDGCLKSVFDTTCGIDFEVIVVDNASSDGSVGMVKDNYPQVHLIENAGNPGFAGANNQAYGVSTGRHFLLLNPDTVVIDGALRKLVEYLDNNSYVGAVGPLVLNGDSSLQYSWARFPSLWGEAIGKLDRGVDGLRRPPLSADEVRRLSPFRTDWVGGCCMMVRREAVEQIGLMDDSLFMYCEETDWCYRLYKAGWSVWVEPCAEIMHLGGQSSKQARAKCNTHLRNSKVAYFRKHRGRLAAGILGGVLSFRMIIKGLLLGGATDNVS